jgi:hypothetical protein
MGTERLLDVRIRDLELRLEGTAMAKRIRRVQDELERRGIVFRPYFWISDEWFTPDGMTGTAIPFYLLHPRLARLERTHVGEVEGGTADWCMRILRHEVGHAIDHAYQFHRRRRWQQLFGLSGNPYPHYYQPNPYSRRHVQHLEYWYAQSHPDEDFAETFAVWLGPRARWRRRYKGWPALRKLEYVDELMATVGAERPVLRTRGYLDPASRMRKTLRQHYEAQSYRREESWPTFYDADLRRLFSDAPRHRANERASAFVRRVQSEIVQAVAPWTKEFRYHMDHVLKELVGRCRALRLRVRPFPRRTKRDLMILVTKYTMDALYRHRGWIEL